ncbi:MAG TPA: hypothetical protein DDZ42_15235 [Candidatus Rokubacteria bacterium]|nr:MAG: hypothetical protein A2050_15100 [Candidatus Rokubacteria bacterium GWA2_73_35]HBH03246.1 hypothetical protein [Candidatus Rokubacteria bacterium]
MPTLGADELVDTIARVAARDASIARVLREIVSLETAVRASALDLVGAHLRVHSAAGDVLDCVDALKRDDVARRLAERLGPPGA